MQFQGRLNPCANTRLPEIIPLDARCLRDVAYGRYAVARVREVAASFLRDAADGECRLTVPVLNDS